MKKITFLATLITMAFSVASCEDSENIPNPYQGKWTPTSVIVNGVATDYSGHTSCGKDYLQLNEFYSLEANDFTEAEVFNPNTNTTEMVCEGKIAYGSYRVMDDNITFYGVTQFPNGKITVNGNEMRITSSADTNNDGTLDTIETVFTK